MIAVVLAAGEGRRMGGPKALLPWGERTLLEAHLAAALRVGCDRVVAIVREPTVRALASATLPRGAALVVSTADDALGPAGSIATFARLAAGRMPHEVAAISPVDTVPRAWRSLERLAAALAGDERAIAARPAYDGHRGHPVLVRATVLEDNYGRATATDPRPLRDVLRAYGTTVVDVPVDDASILADLDTPDDLARWR